MMENIYLQNIYPDYIILSILFSFSIILTIRYRKESLNSFKANSLCALRGLSFILLLIALQNPLLLTSEVLPKQKDVVLILDDSLSSNIHTGKTTRWEHYQNAMTSFTQSHIKDKFNFIVMPMSKINSHMIGDIKSSTQTTQRQTPRFPTTPLKESIQNQLAHYDRTQLSAIILMTDGQATTPIKWDDFGKWDIPIHTVYAKEKSKTWDSHVSALLSPRLCRKGDNISLIAKIYRTDPNKSVNISLWIDDELAEEKAWSASPKIEDEIEFNTVLNEAGWHRLKIKILTPDNLMENNEIDQFIQVTDSAQRVLLAAGSPSYDFRYLREAMIRDETVAPSIYLQSIDPSHPGWTEQNLQSLPDDFSGFLNYDAIVLIDISLEYLTETQLRNLSRWVEEAQGALLLQAGENFPQNAVGTPLESLLPLIPKDPIFRPQGFNIVVPKENSIIDYSLKTSPKFYWACGIEKKSPLSQTAWSSSFGTELAAWTPRGRGKVGFLGLKNLWRLRAYGGDATHYNIYSSFIRFLTENRYSDQSKRARIRLGEEGNIYVNEDVKLRLRLYDRFFKPIEKRSLTCIITEEKGHETELQIPSAGQGRYFSTLHFKTVGEKKINFQFDDLKISHRFVVRTPKNEYRNVGLNIEGLKLLSESTGGLNLSDQSESLKKIIDQLDQIPDSEVRRQAKVLWNMPLYGLSLFILLVTEWVLRRKWNLS